MLNEKLQSIQGLLASEIIQRFYLKGVDDEHYDMLGLHREECRNFLQEAKESGKKILLHCLGGHNRSALIVAAAMIVLERTPVLDVVRHIKSKRGIILTNLSFQRQVCELAAEEGLLGGIHSLRLFYRKGGVLVQSIQWMGIGKDSRRRKGARIKTVIKKKKVRMFIMVA
jgi:hypothetical protein